MSPNTALFILAAVVASSAALRTQPSGAHCRCRGSLSLVATVDAPAAGAAGQEQRCPCLESLGGDPVVGSDQVRHAAVRAAVEEAEQKAAENVEAAAASSGQLWLGRISALRLNESLAAARRTLAAEREAQVERGAQAMTAEVERQKSILAAMENEAKTASAATAQGLTATAAQYAQSVAQNAIFGMASAAVANASALASQAEASRQSASQLAQKAVAAADAVSKGAQEAMRAAAAVPHAKLAEAVALARQIESNTLMLRDRSGQAENLAEQSAQATLANHQLAQVSLSKAMTAENAAQAAHDQAILNSQRLAAMKNRIMAAENVAAEARQASVGLTTEAPTSR